MEGGWGGMERRWWGGGAGVAVAVGVTDVVEGVDKQSR